MNFVLASRDVLHSTAEVCLNLWYFVDDTGMVIRLAGKAYAMVGTDDEKLAALQQMSGTDHLTATQGKVPANFTLISALGNLEGVISADQIHQRTIDVFGTLINQIERELPACIRSVSDVPEKFQMKIPENPLRVTTSVYERADGELVARVAKRE